MTRRDGAPPDLGDRDDEPSRSPAFYAQPEVLRRRWLGDWWTLLHPPYTAWHLSYVVIGACLVGPVRISRLLATLLAFFLAVGIGAHALDELHGRPLRTRIPEWALVAAAIVGIGGATVIGIVGIVVVGPWLTAFVAVGVLLAVGYNLELFGGRLHNDAAFAIGWGAFPVLTAYFAVHDALSVAALFAAGFALLSARAQRQLSTPARSLRRRTRGVEGTVHLTDGRDAPITTQTILGPLEAALKSLSWALVLLATALAVDRLTHLG